MGVLIEGFHCTFSDVPPKENLVEHAPETYRAKRRKDVQTNIGSSSSSYTQHVWMNKLRETKSLALSRGGCHERELNLHPPL